MKNLNFKSFVFEFIDADCSISLKTFQEMKKNMRVIRTYPYYVLNADNASTKEDYLQLILAEKDKINAHLESAFETEKGSVSGFLYTKVYGMNEQNEKIFITDMATGSCVCCFNIHLPGKGNFEKFMTNSINDIYSGRMESATGTPFMINNTQQIS